jgi:type VI protein secretion system component VasF
MRGRRGSRREARDDLSRVDRIPAEGSPRWNEPLQRARRALIEWLSHLLVVAGLLLGFHGIEILLHALGSDDRLLFGQIPLKYLSTLATPL